MEKTEISKTESRLLACFMVLLALFAFCFFGMASANSTDIRSVFYGWKRIVLIQAHAWKLAYQDIRDFEYDKGLRRFLDDCVWAAPVVYSKTKQAAVALWRLPFEVLIGDFTTLKTIKSGIFIGWNITMELLRVLVPPPPLKYPK